MRTKIEVTEIENGWAYKANRDYIIHKDGKVEENDTIIEPTKQPTNPPEELKFRKVEYIESNGTQCINTGFILSAKFANNTLILCLGVFQIVGYLFVQLRLEQLKELEECNLRTLQIIT